MKRIYLRSRRAYTPKFWPTFGFSMVIVFIEATLIQSWWIVPVGIFTSVAIGNVRWMIWRRRHPEITAREMVDDMRRQAPWN